MCFSLFIGICTSHQFTCSNKETHKIWILFSCVIKNNIFLLAVLIHKILCQKIIYCRYYLLPVTYLLRAMWHIRPQFNPANHLCQLQPFVPHSSSSIALFPFLSPPSLSMLSLVFPVFATPLGPRLMQFCSHCLVLSSWCGRWISIFSFTRPHWGFLSQPSTGLLCL